MNDIHWLGIVELAKAIAEQAALDRAFDAQLEALIDEGR